MSFQASHFLTVAEESLPGAIAHGDALVARGYKVTVEPYDLAFPSSPTFKATRGPETLFVEVQTAIDIEALEQWARYGKSCDRDTRICLAVTHGEIDATVITRCRSQGIGVVAKTGDLCVEILPAADLALNMEPPVLPDKLRPLLGGAYDQLERGQWREGFEEACVVLEQQARLYLIDGIAKGRINIVSQAGAVANPTKARVQKMTMGALATSFSSIQNPNQRDSRIAQVLREVNDDRVTVAHYKNTSPARERALRKNVGKHLFRLLAGLRAIKNC